MNNNQTRDYSDVKKLGKVAVIAGGNSTERAVSLVSGESIYKALQRKGVECRFIDAAEQLAEQLVAYRPSCVFIALHGAGGEDGSVQGLLDCMGISYTGSDVLSSALAMDKYRSKLLWQSVGLPTPAFQVISSPDDLEHCHSLLPAFVKPSQEGSSLGVTRVDKEQDLIKAWETARRYNHFVLVEAFIDGPEFTVGIIDGEPLPAVRIDVPGMFYDYDAKYHSNDTRYIVPCGLSKAQEQEMQAIALTAFEVLNCSGWGRVDFIQDEQGRFWLLEVNTIPGMTKRSLFPMAAKQAGIEFDDLVLNILRSCCTDAVFPKEVET
ncbi:MAG: D-alanine--D-alanine ligase [Endozoicomonas sp. (ex Botrylloides leachii)]|nr:D-alanine--D-alanine ligase [Endozoicomonas sp. (ex Botrylloides leachii)]